MTSEHDVDSGDRAVVAQMKSASITVGIANIGSAVSAANGVQGSA
jgi:hypothetical protein